MRNNQPVTQQEIVLQDGCLIVSKTDLKGRITYVNGEFLAISGFTEEELIGEPHNIVRHPDMPSEAFEDLWRDLKAGRPWKGMVKNRCKNGDFYWVQANVAPLVEGGRVVGYISVRRKASAEQIRLANQAYANLRKQPGSLAVSHGKAVSSGLIGRLQRRISEASSSQKIAVGTLVGLLMIFGVAAKLLSNHLTTVLDDQGRATLKSEVGLIRTMVENKLMDLRQQAVLLNQAFDLSLNGTVVAEGDGNAPVLRLAKGGALNGDFGAVDRFTAATGAVATVFARQGDDFLRITTSLKKENGERAVGTLLDRKHPAYKLVSEGKSYVGQALLFGKTYYTSYSPIINAGKVVGITFIGLDISRELESLKKRIRSMKVGESGYYYILDANPGAGFGTLLVHPAKEGANILGAKDAGGREFIRDILERQSGEIIYPWMNAELGETSPRDKIVMFDYLPESRWVVAGGTYFDEFRGAATQIASILAIGGAVLSLLLAVFLFQLIRRLIVLPLQQRVLPVFGAMAEGRYDTDIDASSNDEVGQVLQGLQTMQMQQGFSLAESQRLANENLRVRIALDCVTANLRIADDDGTVLYANRGLMNTLRQIETPLREQQPNFSVDRFIGSNIGSFYADPAAALRTLRELKGMRDTELQIGNRIYKVITNPIINDRGQRLGTIGEWVDRTAEITAQRMVADLISRAAAGDLSARLDTAALEGFYRELGRGINTLLETSGSAIGEIAALLSKIADGDLTQTVDADFEGTFGRLRDDANQTVVRLRELVGEIQLSVSTITTAAKEIAVGNQDLSRRTEEQASSLEQTASSMEQLTQTVKQNADNARHARGLADGAQQVAVDGGKLVGEVVSTMGAIHQSSSKIADIISVIDGIAFQTNILALNAAVEAARAGEQGRGFAVVATEVRNLAQRSAAAAREIKGLITDSVERVEVGNKLVDKAGRTMEEIVASIKGVAQIVNDIAAASVEQSTGIEQVGDAVTHMDQMTQQNAALVEQAAAAAESLEDQALHLSQAVQAFRMTPSRAHEPRALAAPKPHNTKALPSPIEDEWAEF